MLFLGEKGEESALQLKKTILRYCAFSYTLLMSSICPELKKIFSENETAIIEKGLATPSEIEQIKMKQTYVSCLEKWWLPINWACCIAQKASYLLYLQGDS